MKRLIVALSILLVVIVLAALAGAAAVRSRSDSGQVYSVGQLATAVSRDPRAWDGRTVRIVSDVFDTHSLWLVGSSGPDIFLLNDSGVPDLRANITLEAVYGHEDPVLSLYRRLPLVGAAVLPPQQFSEYSHEVYRIQLHYLGNRHCQQLACFQGELVDAVPPGPGFFGGTTQGPDPADPMTHAP